MKADQTSSQGQHVSATLTHSVRYLQAQLNKVTHQKLSWVNWEGGQTTFYSSWEDWNYRRFQGPLLFLILVQRELSFRRLCCRALYHSENSLRKLAKPKPLGCSPNLHLMCSIVVILQLGWLFVSSHGITLLPQIHTGCHTSHSLDHLALHLLLPTYQPNSHCSGFFFSTWLLLQLRDHQ